MGTTVPYKNIGDVDIVLPSFLEEIADDMGALANLLDSDLDFMMNEFDLSAETREILEAAQTGGTLVTDLASALEPGQSSGVGGANEEVPAAASKPMPNTASSTKPVASNNALVARTAIARSRGRSGSSALLTTLSKPRQRPKMLTAARVVGEQTVAAQAL